MQSSERWAQAVRSVWAAAVAAPLQPLNEGLLPMVLEKGGEPFWECRGICGGAVLGILLRAVSSFRGMRKWAGQGILQLLPCNEYESFRIAVNLQELLKSEQRVSSYLVLGRASLSQPARPAQF